MYPGCTSMLPCMASSNCCAGKGGSRSSGSVTAPLSLVMSATDSAATTARRSSVWKGPAMAHRMRHQRLEGKRIPGILCEFLKLRIHDQGYFFARAADVCDLSMQLNDFAFPLSVANAIEVGIRCSGYSMYDCAKLASSGKCGGELTDEHCTAVPVAARAQQYKRLHQEHVGARYRIGNGGGKDVHTEDVIHPLRELCRHAAFGDCEKHRPLVQRQPGVVQAGQQVRHHRIHRVLISCTMDRWTLPVQYIRYDIRWSATAAEQWRGCRRQGLTLGHSRCVEQGLHC